MSELLDAGEYQGLDVLLRESSDAPEDTFERSRLRLDNEVGIPHTVDRWRRGRVTRDGFRVVLHGRAEWDDFRRFLWRRQGRRVPFWLRSDQVDLPLAAPAAADELELIVHATGYSEHQFPQAARRHLALQPAGQRGFFYRRVLDALPEGETERVFLDQALGWDLAAAGTVVSFLLLCRLAADEVELRWHTSEHAEATLALVELPLEVPEEEFS